MEIECRCVPNNPFYLRWLNRLGGFDHWMFEKRQVYELDQSDVQLYQPYLIDLTTADGTHRLAGKLVEEKVTVGAENLTAEDWRLVSGIISAPLVQWYSEGTKRWVDVIVDKTKGELDNGTTYSGVELSLLLPYTPITV